MINYYLEKKTTDSFDGGMSHSGRVIRVRNGSDRPPPQKSQPLNSLTSRSHISLLAIISFRVHQNWRTNRVLNTFKTTEN